MSQQIDQGVTLLAGSRTRHGRMIMPNKISINVVESHRIINWHQSTIISKWYPLTSTNISTYIHSYPPTSTYIPISSCLKHFKTTSYYLHHSFCPVTTNGHRLELRAGPVRPVHFRQLTFQDWAGVDATGECLVQGGAPPVINWL